MLKHALPSQVNTINIAIILFLFIFFANFNVSNFEFGMSAKREDLIRALSLPALTKVHPSSDIANEVTADWCFSSVATHLFFVRSQIFMIVSSPHENSCYK